MLATVVGGNDRRLEEMLRALRAEVSNMPSLEPFTGQKVAARIPDLLIVDTRDQSGLPPALATVRRMHPGIGIIVIAASMDPTMMLEAMRAGVSEFLTEPATVDDLRQSVERVVSLQQGSAEGEMFAFVGGKGGVGTTTVAVNVATTLAQKAKGRVIFVDLHAAHGDAALYFGVEPRFSVLDALENTHRMDQALLKSLVTRTEVGVDLLASSDRATATPLETERVRTLLEFLKRQYSFVIADVPGSDWTMLDALGGSTGIVVVGNQELSTVRGTARIAALMRQCYGNNHVQIVVTRFDSSARIGQEDVEKAVGGRVRHLFPSDYPRALEALNCGRPLVLENHNKLSGSLMAFAQALAGVAPRQPEASTKKTGLLGRLTGGR